MCLETPKEFSLYKRQKMGKSISFSYLDFLLSCSMTRNQIDRIYGKGVCFPDSSFVSWWLNKKRSQSFKNNLALVSIRLFARKNWLSGKFLLRLFDKNLSYATLYCYNAILYQVKILDTWNVLLMLEMVTSFPHRFYECGEGPGNQ